MGRSKFLGILSSSGAASSMVLLDTHTAAGAESSYTFTPTIALDWNTYAEIIISINGLSTLAFNLQCQLNGDTSANYTSNGYRSNGATFTAIAPATTTQFQLADTNVISNAGFKGLIRFFPTSTNLSTPALGAYSEFYEAWSAFIDEKMVHGLNVNYATITAIKLMTSASTWKTGTQITTWGLKRS